MKKLLAIALTLLGLPALAQTRPDLSPQQKLAAAQAVTALVAGPIILPAAVVTGQREALCHLLEGPVLSRRSSFNDVSTLGGGDQCPRGNWLRIIPFIRYYVSNQGE